MSLRVRPGFRFPPLNLTDEELIGQAMADIITAMGVKASDPFTGSIPGLRKG